MAKDDVPCPLTLVNALTTVNQLNQIRVEIHSRKDAVLLAQLHAGHNNSVCAYRHITDPTTNPLCPKCGVEHWSTSALLCHQPIWNSSDPLTSSQPTPSTTSQVHLTGKEVHLRGVFGICASKQQ